MFAKQQIKQIIWRVGIRMNSFRFTVFLVTPLVLSFAAELQANSKEIDTFEQHIRPVLATRCYECHSAEAGKQKGGLLVDSRAGLLKGGESGPAIVPGNSAESILIQAISYDPGLGMEMPPKERLSEATVALFRKWIDAGAHDPRKAKSLSETKSHSTYMSLEEGRKFWAYKTPVPPRRAQVRNTSWAEGPIDLFVLRTLEQKKLRPVGEADRYILLRRITFDLTGLPPTIPEIEDFVRDPAPTPKALEKVVDRLLDSDAFGERWARHWLDIARYAESNGSSRDYLYHHAWRFRDYVIDAFNKDKPYDEFVREQIAGDLMSGDTPEQRDERRIATGFMALSSKDLNSVRNNKELGLLNIGAEQIDVMSRAFMASTIGCAQCHYHKFDPISDEDFYALYGMFRSSRTLSGLSGRSGQETNTLDLIPLEEEPSGAQQLLTADLQAAIEEHGPPLAIGTSKGLNKPGSKQAIKAQQAHEQTMVDLARLGLTAPERYQRLEDFVPVGRVKNKKPLKLELNPKLAWVLGAPLAMGMTDRDEPGDAPLLIGGEPDKPDQIVPRGFPKVMDYPGAKPFSTEESGRLELAEWMTHPNHPLTARVMVNRVWGHLFGSGIVESVDNFGTTGARPTHPEMLDFLAIQFTRDDWSVKRLIRRMVLSRTYRQKGEDSPAAAEIDPDNRLLWRMSAKRLEGEAIRDSLIAISGQLQSRPKASPLALVRTIGTFQHKPDVKKHDRKYFNLRGSLEISNEEVKGYKRLVASPFEFKPRGESGLMISDLFPHLGEHADDLCLLNGMYSTSGAHPQGQLALHTGVFNFSRPSMAAWINYALGSENPDLPGALIIGKISPKFYGSAFLPAHYQGVGLNLKGNEAVPNIERNLSDKQQQIELALLNRMNRKFLEQKGGDSKVEAVRRSFDTANVMQTSVPEIMDLPSESSATQEMYGVGDPACDEFAKACLLARKISESGVRYVQLRSGNWDNHGGLKSGLTSTCAAVDRPIAGLLADLKQRSLLDETLVIWGGEFGRGHHSSNSDGRDHNSKGFTMWMAGGGVKGGFAYGGTDELGIHAVSGRMHTNDLHATMLHLLGIDHERLTYPYSGREFRLTDLGGVVAKDIIA